MVPKSAEDWLEPCLDKYPDLPSVALIRSVELKHFPRGLLRDPVLDLCCGDGFFAWCLGLKNAYGCDIDAGAIARAGRLKGTFAGVRVCDARDLRPFTDGEFNTVFSNCALEHIDGVDRALQNVARVLRKGGRLIMTVPGENLNRWFFPKVALSAIGFPGYGLRLRRIQQKTGTRERLSVPVVGNEAVGQRACDRNELLPVHRTRIRDRNVP